MANPPAMHGVDSHERIMWDLAVVRAWARGNMKRAASRQAAKALGS